MKTTSQSFQPEGNFYDKYGTTNPIARYLMDGFFRAFDELTVCATSTVYEAGCGEGHLSLRLAQRGLQVKGSDISSTVILEARKNAEQLGYDLDFTANSIYQLNPEIAKAQLVVCCEVLEHLEEPEKALSILTQLADPYLLVSVPREPIWRILNLVRGSYISSFGNTPGHLQHWSCRGFLHFLQQQVDIIEVRTPLPWTMVLCQSRK